MFNHVSKFIIGWDYSVRNDENNILLHFNVINFDVFNIFSHLIVANISVE